MKREATSGVATKEPKVSSDDISVEHIRIVSDKPHVEVRKALENLPKSDDRTRAFLHYGEFERVTVELNKIQSDAGLVIFSVATHGDWLQIRAANATPRSMSSAMCLSPRRLRSTTGCRTLCSVQDHAL
jgi:hypothetical protein